MYIAIHHLKSFEPRPNSRALGTVGSVIIGCAHSKNRFDVRRQGTLSIQPKLWKNLETAANSTEISHKKLQKSRKLLNFRNATNSPNSESKVDHEWKENFLEIFFSKLWVYVARLASFLEILENAVPFACGSCRKFKPDVLVEWEAPNID